MSNIDKFLMRLRALNGSGFHGPGMPYRDARGGISCGEVSAPAERLTESTAKALGAQQYRSGGRWWAHPGGLDSADIGGRDREAVYMECISAWAGK